MPKDPAIKLGVMSKKSLDTKGIAWTPRLIMLTESTVFFAKADDPRRVVLDYIDLCDIVSWQNGPFAAGSLTDSSRE